MDVTDLGTLGGEQSIAFAVNESDQVVGLSWTTNGSSHSFLYSNGEMIDLYPLNSQDLITAGPTSINNLGQVASGAISSDGVYYPVVYDSRTGELATQGSLGGVTSNGFSGVATAINNFGQAVGYSYLDGVNRHAFIYQKGTLRDLGCLQGDDGPCTTYAFGVNDQGQVVGSSGRAFLYSNGVMTDISPFGSLASYADLKKAGVAVLGWGQFLTVVINFLILALVIFMLVRWATRMMKKPADAPAGPSEVDLLTEIRDELKRRP